MAFSKDKAHDRAEKYAARGQHDRAAREYQTIVEHDPKDVRAWLMLADSLARTGDRAGAVSRYQQVGDFYASSREFQKALAVYRQVLNLDPSRLDIHYKCAQLNMEVGRVHDAIASFESIAQNQLQSGRVAEALETYRTIADADPTVVSKRLRLAELYSREKMVDPAVESFRMASQVLLDAGRHADYVRVAERLVYHKAGDRETIRELARVYLHLGDARRALMKLNGLLQADPGDAAGLELLAETFMALGKPDKASSVIGELVRKLREAGDDDAATRALDMGLDWIPNDADLLALRGGGSAQSAVQAPDPTPAPTSAPSPSPTPIEPSDSDSDAIDLELDDADVVELDDGDFVLTDGDAGSDDDFSDGIDLDFGGASDAEILPARSEPDAGPAAAADPGHAASTSMTDHVLEEVSQSTARGQDLGAEGELVDASGLTDSDKLLFEARVYVKYRLFDHALEHLNPLLADHPEHVPALSLSARSLTELERHDEAASMHARIAVLVEGGDPKLAREHVQAALSFSPRHPEALAVQSRLEAGAMTGAAAGAEDKGAARADDILDFDAAVADDALELDDIAIDVAEPEAELELELDTNPIVVENRFGISEAGPLPEADPTAGLALSIAPTEQMQALQRARSSEDTPPTAFIPRHPTVEMDAGPPERSPTAVDIEAGAPVPTTDKVASSNEAIAELLDDEDSSLLRLEPESSGPQEASFAGLEFEVDADDPELSDTPTPTRAPEPEPEPESKPDFDAEFDAAFEDGFDELLDVNAPEPALTQPQPAAPAVTESAATPATPPAVELVPEPPGGWPDLSDDLAEIRFYLDQGLDEDAEAALTELADGHPGHPEISKMRGDVSGAQSPSPAESAGAMPLVDLDRGPDEDPGENADDDADEDAYLSAIFGGGDDKPSKAAKTSRSVGVSAKAQDVAGANARDRFDLGMAYREMGLVDSAVAEFEGACSDPQWESRSRVMLGALRVLQGDIDAAVSDLQRASATAGNDEEQRSAAYELAVVYEKAGDNAAAIELFEGIAAGFRERDAKLAQLRG